MIDHAELSEKTSEPASKSAQQSASSPKPKVVDKEDRLELENLQIKLQNVKLQLQIMQNDLAKALETQNDLVAKMKKKREEFFQKYGVDIAKINIDDEGNITPLPTPNINMPGL